ncbi:MAG: class I SAM-dependent methyltransferase [Acidobacteria bacterium]|nr:class I SAM-dependent methyltransferase [Acidobacteriota bacterium]
MLDKWNRRHALTALPPSERLEELFLDACVLLPWIEALPPGALAVDFGSGHGLSAALLAAANPRIQVAALEASGKKVAFIGQLRMELGLENLRPLAGRAELLPPLGAQAGTAKAVGSVDLLLSWWMRHGDGRGPFLALKGPSATGEGRARPGWTCVAHPYRLPTRGSRVLLEFRESKGVEPRA